MESLFSDEIDGNHYRPSRILRNLSDVVPPASEPETGISIPYDWDLPDAMVVVFSRVVSANDESLA